MGRDKIELLKREVEFLIRILKIILYWFINKNLLKVQSVLGNKHRSATIIIVSSKAKIIKLIASGF